MSRKKANEIRIDDSHSIKLRVSKWFPEMTILTIVLAIFGSFFYGDMLTTSSGFSAGKLEVNIAPVPEKADKKFVNKVKVVSASVVRKDVQPRIIGAETKLSTIKIELENTTLVGDSAIVTYRIYNTGKKLASGSTWSIGDNPNQPLNKQIHPWKARTFTRKTASFPLTKNSPVEFKIYVSDDLAKIANYYTIRF